MEPTSYLAAYLANFNCYIELIKPIAMPASYYFIIKYSLLNSY